MKTMSNILAPLTNLFSKGGNGVAIELAPERINICQIRKQGQGYKLKTFHTLEVPEGIFQEGKIQDAPSLAQLIRQGLDESKIKADTVATAVPMREAVIRIIPVPAELDDKELREMVLNHEAGLYLPYPREEVDVDYQKLGFFMDDDGIEKVKVLLVATRKEITNTYIDTFQEAGLKISVLEINSFALIRAIREQLRHFTSQEAAVLVDIEFDSTEIAIIVDGVPGFNRTVPIGTYQLQTSLSLAMNLTPERDISILQGMTIPTDAERTGATTPNPGMNALIRGLGELTDELRRSIDFYLNQTPDLEIAQLFLAGPGGGIGKLDEFFTQRLSLPTTQVDPISTIGLQLDQEISETQKPGLGTVLGLGLRLV